MEQLKNASKLEMSDYESYIEDQNVILDIVQEIVEMNLRSFSNNFIRVWLIKNQLKREQLEVFMSIHRIWSSILDVNVLGPKFINSSCSLIEAPPGTGKTYLVGAMAVTSFDKSTFLAYSCNLRDMMNGIAQMDSLTYNSFIMRHMKYEGSKVTYFGYQYVWNKVDLSLGDQFCKLFESAKESKPPPTSILFCDEIYMIPVFELIWLWMYSKIHNVQLIFTGDRKQQSYMRRMAGYPKNNYPILQIICNVFELSRVVRQEGDAQFINKLEQFRNMMHLEDFTETDVALKFNHLFELYTLFMPHFYQPINFDALYMATFHRTIKRRTDLWEQYHMEQGSTMINIYYELANSEDPWLREFTSTKFVPYLTCVIGCKYIYTNVKTRMKQIVTLLQVKRKSIVVSDANDTLLEIPLAPINIAFMPQELVKDLSEYASSLFDHVNITPSSILTYPIRPLTCTYYSVQGMTLSVDKLDLSLDSASCNAVYTGLTRLTSQIQIGLLETTKLKFLEFTHFMNDEYYYRFPITDITMRMTKAQLAKEHFALVASTSVFEAGFGAMKILRNAYWPIQQYEGPSQLELMVNIVRDKWSDIIVSDSAYFKSCLSHVSSNTISD